MKINHNKNNLELSINNVLTKKFENFTKKKHKNKNDVKNFFKPQNAKFNATKFSNGNSKAQYDAIDEQRRRLPVNDVRDKIIDIIKKHETLIIIGETACGKTTQIPQILYDANFIVKSAKCHNQIGVTQPRRVAAISIATRVAQEMRCPLGSIVGYCVRFTDVTTDHTKIKYLTDGILLREAIGDPLLNKYRVIVLDEAHERTIHTDILFGVIKRAQNERKDKQMPLLKVIIMSATMDVDHFSTYFCNCPVYYLPGREYPIKVMYTKNKQSDYVHSALVTVLQVHRNEPEGDILAFCTGQEEIDSMVRVVKESIPHLPSEYQNLSVFALYAALPSNSQFSVFKTLPKGRRKVIFATNVAETSITIPNIKYVIDTGMVKSRDYNSITGFEMLKVRRISKAEACQRAGRAGRVSSGICYRLYTKEEYNSLNKFSTPEIQRCNLANVILHLIAIGINDILKFDFLDKPSDENINNAIQQLNELNAIETKGELNYLTEMGKTMVLFPVEPKFSKIIIASKNLRCTDEIITIIALLSSENVFYIPPNLRKEALESHKKFTSSGGDIITLLNVYRAYKNQNHNIQWCRDNFIHNGNLEFAIAIRKQLSDICEKANIPKCSCGDNTELIRKCLTLGLSSNIAALQRDGNYKTISTKQEVYIHPSSCLFGSKPEYVVFNDIVETTKSYMRNLSVISYEWIISK